MRVLVTGGAGQLGRALSVTIPPGIDARFTTRADLDIENRTAVHEYVTAFEPDLIVNSAAYTAVDRAESEELQAMRANALAPRYLAEAAQRSGHCRLIQISTDFVFDGTSSKPYEPEHPVAPLSVYGRSKAEGEIAVLQTLGERALIVRTAWVYSSTGNNFVRTMLRLLEQRGEVAVVDDQLGTPTAAHSLAGIVWRFATRGDLSGVFHWADAGVASWYDFATAIAEEAQSTGLLRREVMVRPIASRDYPTLAKRPPYSVLDKRSAISTLGIEPCHWRKQLRIVLQELSHA